MAAVEFLLLDICFIDIFLFVDWAEFSPELICSFGFTALLCIV